MEMNNRNRAFILIFISIIITAFLGWLMMSKKKPITKQKNQITAKAIEINRVEIKDQKSIIKVSGKVNAYNKIDIYAQVTGILLNQTFREGNSFLKNQVVAKIDDAELLNSLKAQKSSLINSVALIMGDLSLDYPEEMQKWKEFLEAININKPITNLPKITNAKLNTYLSGNKVLSEYYSIKSTEEKLKKHQITAPYTGILSEVNIEPGALVRAGQKIGSFVADENYDFITDISLKDKKYISIGQKINLSTADKNYIATIYKINPILNPSAQTVKVYAKVKDPNLIDGQFLTGEISGKTFPNTASIKRELIHNNKVYVVKENTLSEKEVNVLFTGEVESIVEGLNQGDIALSRDLNGLYKGMKISVINP